MNIRPHIQVSLGKPKDQAHLQDRTEDVPKKDGKVQFVTINKPAIPHEIGFAIAISVVATTLVGLTLASAVTFNYIDNHKAATS